MLYSDHLMEHILLFGSNIKSHNTWTLKWSTLIYTGETKCHFLVCEYEHIGKSILIEKNLKYTKKDPTAIRNHCHNHCSTADTSCFSLVGNAANKYYLKLKESLLILKMKPSLIVAKESTPLYLSDNDS